MSEFPNLTTKKFDDSDRFSRHVRHYLLRNAILLEEVSGILSEVESDESSFSKVLIQEAQKKIREVTDNQIEAISAAFAKSHTVPVLK